MSSYFGIADAQISPQDPYAHFRRPGHACYNKLFDIEEIERFERETAAGIAGIQLGEDIDWQPEPRGIWEW
jgi:E3 ubiquitin-protein ligase RNF14